MRVGVIGAGAVGGAIAALLARVGHDVEVTARGANLAVIAERGIRLRGAWGEHTAIVLANERLTRAPELVIVATKAQDAAAAVSDNLAMLRNVPVLVMQNGLHGVTGVAAASPSSDVVGGLALFAASYLSPGEVTITAPGQTVIGGALGDSDVPTRYIAGALGAVMPVSIVANFVGAQWSKLIVNQINALPAITGLSAQAVIADRRLRRIMTASMREATRVGIATGVRYGSLHGLDNAKLRVFSRLPLWIGQVLPWELSRRMGSTPNPGSTLQSIRRGQATEIDYLNGAVVAAAAAIGRRAPINELLVDLVHEVESTRVFIDPAEVVARVQNRVNQRRDQASPPE